VDGAGVTEAARDGAAAESSLLTRAMSQRYMRWSERRCDVSARLAGE
jgi:hypothetical protein